MIVLCAFWHPVRGNLGKSWKEFLEISSPTQGKIPFQFHEIRKNLKFPVSLKTFHKSKEQ